MPVTVSFHVFGALTYLATVGTVVLAGLVASGYIKKTLLDTAKTTQDMQSGQVEVLKKQVKQVQRVTHIQERRLYRVEIESARKERLYLIARQEVDILEELLRVIVPHLTRFADDDRRRVEAILTRLTDFRRKSATEQEEWEETNDALLAFADRGPLPREDDEEDR